MDCHPTPHEVFTLYTRLSKKVVFKNAYFPRPRSPRYALQPCFSNRRILKPSGLLSSVPMGTSSLRTKRHILGSSIWIDGHLKPDFILKIFFEVECKLGINFLMNNKRNDVLATCCFRVCPRAGLGTGWEGYYLYFAIRGSSGKMFERLRKTELRDLREKKKIILIYLPGSNYCRQMGIHLSISAFPWPFFFFLHRL